jgi:hypothetical protein
MLRFRSSLCSFALLCAASSAAAQGTSPVPPASMRREHTCDESALRALAADPGRVTREGSRVSLVPPAGMREVTGRPPFVEGFTPVLLMADDSSDAMLLVAFANEVPQVDAPSYQERRRRIAEGDSRLWTRWIQRQVVDLGGGIRAYLMDYVIKRRRHDVALFMAFQGRTLIVHFTNPDNDPRVQTKINESIGTLVVRDCALAPGSTTSVAAADAARAGGAADAVCEEPALQAHLAAGDPRREAIADGRISLVPPEGMEELTSIQASHWLPRSETPPLRVFAGDTAAVWLRYFSVVADVESPVFQAAMEQVLGGEHPDRISWISREVVEQGGARWLRLEYTFRPRRGGESLSIFYATGFQGRILTAWFTGPRRVREALARSAATLEVRDCRVSRPLRAWVDSAAVARAAAALEPPQMPTDMKPIFRVTFDTAGVVETVEPVFTQIPAPYADAVVAALRAAVRPKPRSRYPTAHLVRVVGGAAPLVDSPELIERAPVVRDPEWIGRRLGDLSNMLMFRPGTSRRAAPGFYVRMRVLPDGKVDRESVQLLRGSGVQWLDEAIVGIARRTSFRPGEVDGFAARTWVVLPMSLHHY